MGERSPFTGGDSGSLTRQRASRRRFRPRVGLDVTIQFPNVIGAPREIVVQGEATVAPGLVILPGLPRWSEDARGAPGVRFDRGPVLYTVRGYQVGPHLRFSHAERARDVAERIARAGLDWALCPPPDAPEADLAPWAEAVRVGLGFDSPT